MAWCRKEAPLSSGPVGAPYTGSLMDATRWAFQYSPGMPPFPKQIGAVWGFDFPILPASVHYLVAAINRPVTDIYGEIEITGDGVFTARIPNQDADDGVPAVRPYFQRRGDNVSGAGEFEHYRWWSNPALVQLRPGVFTVSAPLDPARWSSVYGKTGDTVPEAFAAAVANCVLTGMTFGGWFAGHGVALTSGSAAFICRDWRA